MRWKIHFNTIIVVLFFSNVIYSSVQEIRIRNFCEGSIENIAKENERCGYLYLENKPRYIVVASSYDIIPLGVLTRNHLLIGNIDTQEIQVFSKFIAWDMEDRLGMMGVSWLDSVIAGLLFLWGDSNSFIYSDERKMKIERKIKKDERNDIMKFLEKAFNAA